MKNGCPQICIINIIFFKAASVNIRVILKENCEQYDGFWNYHNENSSVSVPKKQNLISNERHLH